MLRWAIIGAGRIARKVGLAMQQSSSVVIQAVYARRRESAQALADTLGAPRVYDVLDGVWQDGTIDAVYIALPNHLHAPVALAAIAAGKHVLIEKPMACSATEVASIHQAADQAGVVVMEAMMYRFHPQTTQVLALITAGDIGEVRQVQVQFGYRQDNPHDIRMIETVGGGAIYDIGCYGVSLAQLVTQATPTSVQAMGIRGGNDVDVLTAGIFGYQHQCQTQLNVSFLGGFYQQARIIGYDGVIEIERPFTVLPDRESVVRLWRGAHFAKESQIVVPPASHFVHQAEVFAHAVAASPTQRLVLTQSSATLANALVIDAWHRAMHSGQCESVGM
jgi:D-xylose 1-dehydrogenase (NADP+, D-xylono-1,5-lactone-forming)